MNHPIRIQVDQYGNFTYTPALQHAASGDTVSWECDDGNFSVSFSTPDGTPFDVLGFHGQRGTSGTGAQPFRGGVLPGVYHYIVAVARVAGGEDAMAASATVFVNGGCPELEIP